MIKTIGMLKRRPGMTVPEFRAYYETHHRVIGEKYLSGFASRYMRRFITPSPNRETGEVPEPDFDVVLEIWYPDRATFEACGRVLAAPDAVAEIVADEERLFDRPRMRFFVIEEECESELPDPRSEGVPPSESSTCVQSDSRVDDR